MAYTNKVKIEQYKKAFPTRLRNLMEEKGISQAELARLMQESGAKITPQAIGAYCRGETMPRLEYAQIIADCFNVSLDYLSGHSEVQSKNETIQSINEETGLSSNAIATLKTEKMVGDTDITHFISYLIGCKDLSRMISIIKKHNQAIIANDKTWVDFEEFQEEIDLAGVCKVMATDIFWEIAKNYKEEG